MASARTPELRRAGAEGAADASGDLALVPSATAAHTSVCFWSTAACSRTLGCTMVFDAVNCELLPIERQRFRSNRHDAVFADDAILLAAADQFSGQQQQRTLAAVDEHELVHGGAAVILRHGNGPNLAAVAHHADSPAFADDHFAARETFFQRQKAAGVLRGAANHGKNRNVFVDDWIEDAPMAFRTGSGLMWLWSSPNKSEASKSGDGRQGGNGHSEKRALHGTSLQGIRKTCSGIRTGRLRFLARKQN